MVGRTIKNVETHEHDNIAWIHFDNGEALRLQPYQEKVFGLTIVATPYDAKAEVKQSTTILNEK